MENKPEDLGNLHFGDKEPAKLAGGEGETDEERERRQHPEMFVVAETAEGLWQRLGPETIKQWLVYLNFDPNGPLRRKSDEVLIKWHQWLTDPATAPKSEK